MSKESYNQIQADLQNLEKFMKDSVELYFDLKVERFEAYDYKDKNLVAIFKATDNKKYYLEIFPDQDEPIVRPIIND